MKKVKRKDCLGHDAEYEKAAAEWLGPGGKLAKSGFHDIEKEDGQLEQEAHTYELNDQVHHAEVVFDRIPVEIFSSALHRYNFSSADDHKICEMLSEGRTFKEIKTAVNVGQGRIERVRAEVKKWHDVGFNLLSDVE